jgi:hypothetical protein
MAEVTRRELLAARGPKHQVDPRRPYAFLVERERSAAGRLEDVATIFLTNRECPFSCVYCDLWKNTTDGSVQPGDIPAQIDYALSRLPPAKIIKLYNSGNFFDPQAIPPKDHQAIIGRVKSFERVIVENHPSLISEKCVRFRANRGRSYCLAMSRRAISASGVLDSPMANRGCECRSITTQLRPRRVSSSDMRLPAKPEPMMATSGESMRPGVRVQGSGRRSQFVGAVSARH